METIHLTGITWNHTRGFVPKVATGQRFQELNPHVDVQWDKRSLQDFADFSIGALAARYDLLVIDHPSIGEAAEHGLFRALEELLPASFLADQAAHSVGSSYASYRFADRQWALAVDAAAPVASWRPDIMERLGLSPPRTWEELMTLARRGLVAVPAIPVDTLMNLYMMWIDAGEEPFLTDEGVGSHPVGRAALETLRELILTCAPVCRTRNPIQTYEAMTQADDIAYCPFAYGYSNYSRDGYAGRRLAFGHPPSGRSGALRSTLGGAGLAISANCRHPEVAAQYAAFMASGECQRGLYVSSGGQPGHRSAWLDVKANELTSGFFRDTLAVLDNAYLRPRYNGYIAFQDQASACVDQYVSGHMHIDECLRDLDKLHRHCKTGAKGGDTDQRGNQ